MSCTIKRSFDYWSPPSQDRLFPLCGSKDNDWIEYWSGSDFGFDVSCDVANARQANVEKKIFLCLGDGSRVGQITTLDTSQAFPGRRPVTWKHGHVYGRLCEFIGFVRGGHCLNGQPRSFGILRLECIHNPGLRRVAVGAAPQMSQILFRGYVIAPLYGKTIDRLTRDFKILMAPAASPALPSSPLLPLLLGPPG